MKSVSVIIPNYNGRKLLEKYLPFLYRALHYSKLNFEIIIPDDASADDSKKFISENYPDIIFIEGKVNVGFGGNTNRGISKAAKDLVFLLNSDVKLTENYFECLMPYFEDEKVFGVMGALTTESDNYLQDGAKYPKWKKNQMDFTLNYESTDKSPALSLFLSGANALIDRKKIQMIGGFDDIFNPFYFEDSELGLRSWRLGWKNYFEPRAVCYHEISSTIKKFNQRKKIKIISRRNKWFLHAIHLEGKSKSKFLNSLRINLLYRWITRDFAYYTSWKQFRSRKNQIENSVNNLKVVSQKVNPLKSCEEVTEEILKSVKGKNIRLF
jgi:GT2 family glycosyltransferase